jgi:hypothetical protein
MPKASNDTRLLAGALQAGAGGPAISAGTPSQGGVFQKGALWRSPVDRGFLLMLFVVALSGNPVLSAKEDMTPFFISVGAMLLGLAVLHKKRLSVSRRGFSILALFGGIIAVQTVHFQVFSAVTILGLLCRLVIAYCAVVLIPDFAGTYVRVMLGLAVLSFVFYFGYLGGAVLGIDVAALTRPFALYDSDIASSILVHTFFSDPPDAYRNAGMFWEPGAFAGYVNLALVFLCLIRERFTKRAYLVRFVVLSVCLLTTKSTVGYIAYAVVLCLEVMARERHSGRAKLIAYLGAGFVLAVFCALAANLEFIAPKIENSILVATTQTGGWQADRLGSILFDLDYITARPLTGWGMRQETRLALNPELTDIEANGRGNGMSNFAATFGVIALVVWLLSSYHTLLLLSPQRKMLTVLGLLVLVISLNGECFLNFPLFLMFFFSSGSGRRWLRFLPLSKPVVAFICPE